MRYFPNRNDKKDQKSLASSPNSNTFLRNMISEIGRTLAKSQEIMDHQWIEQNRHRIQLLKQGYTDRHIPLPTTFVIPEATLDLKIDIRNTQSGELIAAPVNPETIQKENIDIAMSNRLKMKFVLLPNPENVSNEEQEIPPVLDPQQVLGIASENVLVQMFIKDKNLSSPHLIPRFRADSKKWGIEIRNGANLVGIFIIDDSTANPIDIIDLEPPVRAVDMKQLGPPVISSLSFIPSVPLKETDATKSETSGEILAVCPGDSFIIEGDNLVGLDFSDTLLTLGNIEITPMEISLKKIQFQVSNDMTGGSIKIQTPYGKTMTNPIVVIAKPNRLNPSIGYYNPLKKSGSPVVITGGGLTISTELEFTGGVSVSPSQVIGTHTAVYHVPEGAFSGPVALLTKTPEKTYRKELMPSQFMLRPFITRVKPKQAKKGDKIIIQGNHLSSVSGIMFGNQIFTFKSIDGSPTLNAHISETALVIEIPAEAIDGEIIVLVDDLKFPTGVIFYHIPSLIHIPPLGVGNTIMEIMGFGFGEFAESITVRFKSKDGVIDATAQYLQKHPSISGARIIGVKIPRHAVTGKIQIIRAEVYNNKDILRTSAISEMNIFIFNQGSDIDSINLETWIS